MLVVGVGFKEAVNACCGYGPYGGIFTCGGNKKVSEYKLCENANEHVWWDSFHPTEIIHQEFAKALWEGPPFSVGPYNLQHLFFNFSLHDKLADILDGPEGDHFQ